MVPPRPSRKTPRLSDPPIAARRDGFLRSARNSVDTLPSSFRCALSGSVLRDPVRTCDGHVYERAAIEDWLKNGHTISPVTGIVLENTVLTTHKALQAAILAYMAACEDPEIFNDCNVEETIQEQPDEDELVDLFTGLQSQLTLANQDLAEEPHTAVAEMIQDRVDKAKKVVLVATGSDHTSAYPNGEDLSPLGQESTCDPGELLPSTPVSARLAAPGMSASMQDLHLDSGLGSGHSSSSASLQLAKSRSRRETDTLLSRSRAQYASGNSQLKDSRSPSPEMNQDAGKSVRRSKITTSPISGRTKATPRRPPGSNGVERPPGSNGVERNGVVSAREGGTIQNRTRVRSPGASGTASASSGPRKASSMSTFTRDAGSAASLRRDQVTVPSSAKGQQRGPSGPGARSRGDGSGPPSRRNSAAPTPPLPQGPVERAAAIDSVISRGTRGNNEADGIRPDASAYPAKEVANTAAAQTDEAGRTPLMHAAREGDLLKVEALVKRNAAVDSADACRCTALMYAATYGQSDAARFLITHRADVDAASQDCWTPLIAAAYNGHLHMAQLLLSKKASIDSADERGWTSLMHVAFNGNNDTLRCLLYHRANVEAEDAEGRTAVVYAAFNGHLENVKCLLARADKVTLRSDPARGDGPSGLALLFAASHGHVEVVRGLLEASAASQQTRQDALKFANSGGHHAVVELLVRRSAFDQSMH